MNDETRIHPLIELIAARLKECPEDLRVDSKFGVYESAIGKLIVDIKTKTKDMLNDEEKKVLDEALRTAKLDLIKCELDKALLNPDKESGQLKALRTAPSAYFTPTALQTQQALQAQAAAYQNYLATCPELGTNPAQNATSGMIGHLRNLLGG